VLIFLES